MFKQTIRTKRAWAGIKMYPLCTSDGITMSVRIHTETERDISFQDGDLSFSKSEQIVLNLLNPYFGKGYHLYTDNVMNFNVVLVYVFRVGSKNVLTKYKIDQCQT